MLRLSNGKVIAYLSRQPPLTSCTTIHLTKIDEALHDAKFSLDQPFKAIVVIVIIVIVIVIVIARLILLQCEICPNYSERFHHRIRYEPITLSRSSITNDCADDLPIAGRWITSICRYCHLQWHRSPPVGTQTNYHTPVTVLAAWPRPSAVQPRSSIHQWRHLSYWRAASGL